MKKYILILSLLVFVSCQKDFLDVTDPNRLTPDSYWKTQDQAMATLTAAYSTLQFPQWGRWGMTEIGWPAENYKADDIIIRDDRQAWIDIHTFTNIPGNNTTDNFWFYCYLGINYSNQCLKYFPTSGLSDIDLKQMTAEARFIRAYQYFLLVNYYRNVPLITTVPTSTSEYYPKQASPAEVWTQIESDLTYAKDNLSSVALAPGRVTKGSASALLGKAYMQQLKWSQAASAFEEVINSSQYNLVSEFASLFTGTNENSSESIFEIQFSLQKPKGIDESQPLPMNIYSDGWNEFWPEEWLVAQYLKDKTANGEYSKRAWGSISFGSNDPHVYPVPFSESDITKKALWKKYAYVDASLGVDNYDAPANSIVIRYADVLLLYAEAQNELGNTGAAINAINQVRNRAGVPQLLAVMSQADIRTHLREFERPVELAIEGIRWLDLLRWDDMNPGFIRNTFISHNRRAATNYTDKYKYYPIPQQDMNSNPNLVQNPGY
ncbi:MAG: RagB/SusD family nutrient uptake outer membrane protein [Mobilitalea sp.]